MNSRQKTYRIDIAAYGEWMAANCYGSCRFTEDDIVFVSGFSADGEWAYNVSAAGYFVTEDELPARFLVEVTP